MTVIVDDIRVATDGLAKSLIPKEEAVGVFSYVFAPLGEQTNGVAIKRHGLVEVGCDLF